MSNESPFPVILVRADQPDDLCQVDIRLNGDKSNPTAVVGQQGGQYAPNADGYYEVVVLMIDREQYVRDTLLQFGIEIVE